MAERVTPAVAYAASGGAIIGGLTANEWMALTGAVCAVVTALANIYFKRRFARNVERSICDECPLNDARRTP